MKSYKCIVCGWVYDPDNGDESGNIPPGTSFDDLPVDWVCPECGATRDEFNEV